MVAGETRLEEYKTKYTTLADVELGTFLNICFEMVRLFRFMILLWRKSAEKQ